MSNLFPDTEWLCSDESIHFRRLNNKKLLVKGSTERGYYAWVDDELLEHHYKSAVEAIDAAEWSATS